MPEKKDLFNHAHFATTHGLVSDALAELIRLFDEGGKASEVEYISIQRLTRGDSRLIVKYYTTANSNSPVAEYWQTDCRGIAGALSELESACKLGVFHGVPDGYPKARREKSNLVSRFKGDYDV